MKIGICGFGFVGSAVYNSIKNKDNVYIYDPIKRKNNPKEKLLNTDFIFICVPTPYNNGFDSSYINEILTFLNKNNYQGIVIIKSTVHPKYLTDEINNLKLVSNPEFLSENSALDDFRNQKTILLGGDLEYCYKVKDLYENEFDLNVEKYKFVSFEEALIFKYLRNIKIAYEVMFLEFVQETTNNYRIYRNIFKDFPVNVDQIRLDGKPGFGGHCLPKDTKSYPKSMLTDFLIKYNEKIRK